jgi:tetratricopeptide (TPR) repeat protein
VRRYAPLALVLILVLSGAGVWRTGVYLDHFRYSGDVEEELMYFPSGRLTEIASLGFDSLASAMLWLRGIQYYGTHKKSDHYFLLAEHIFQTITDLDPYFLNAYRFGAFVISQDMGQPAGGADLLRKGMRNNFDSWQLPFDLGFLYFVDAKDEKTAAHYFRMASRFPDAPEIAKRFSAFAYKKAGNYDVAKRLWEEIYESTTNEAMKDNAVYALKMIEIDENLVRLDKALAEYRSRRGSAPRGLRDLVTAGLVRAIPDDPFGGGYFLDPGTGRALNTTKVELEADRVTAALKKKIDYYYQRTGAYPESLGALAEEDLITEVPEVAGAVIVYDAAHGTVHYVMVEES